MLAGVVAVTLGGMVSVTVSRVVERKAGGSGTGWSWKWGYGCDGLLAWGMRKCGMNGYLADWLTLVGSWVMASVLIFL